MNAYWTAHLYAAILGTAPVWDAQILDDAAPGHILVSDDDGDTWRLARAETDTLSGAAFALRYGRAGEVIPMTSRGSGIVQVVASSYQGLGLLEHDSEHPVPVSPAVAAILAEIFGDKGVQPSTGSC